MGSVIVAAIVFLSFGLTISWLSGEDTLKIRSTREARLTTEAEEALSLSEDLTSKNIKFEKKLQEAISVREELRSELKKAKEEINENNEVLGQLKDRFDTAMKENEAAKLSLGQLAKEAEERKRTDLQERVAGLENRMTSFEEARKGMEEGWLAAKVAILQIEETAKKIESGLEGVLEKEAAGADIDIVTLGGVSRFKAELEDLRQARKNARLAIEKAKITMMKTMEAETKAMIAAMSEISDVLSATSVGYTGVGGEAATEIGPGMVSMLGEQLPEHLMLQKRLEEINLKIIDATEESEAVIGLEEEAAERYKEIQLKRQWFTVYVVSKRDTLWTIAEREDVYGDPHTWPLIYKYNVVWLRDPDELVPGQILILKTYPTDGEIEDALSKAKGRGPWEVDHGHVMGWVTDWLK